MAAPTFNLTYNVPPVDIGEGYAKGIGEAGKSIVDALKNVTSIMSQSAEANDQIEMFSRLKDAQGNPVMSQEDKDALMSKGLGTRQAFIGELMGRWGSQYKAHLASQAEIEKEKALQPLALERLRATAEANAANQAAEDARRAQARQAEITASGEEQRKTQQQEYDLKNAPVILTPSKPPKTGVSEADKQAEIQRRRIIPGYGG